MNGKLFIWIFIGSISLLAACDTSNETTSSSSQESNSISANLPEHFEIKKINSSLSSAVHKPDEFIREEGYLRDGRKSGYWFKFFNRRNKIQRIEHYVNGILNGPVREYSMNGRLDMEAYYKNGVLDGLYTKYKHGKRINEAFYVNNQKNGVERIYFEDRNNLGVLQQVIHWKMGKMDGPMEYYNPEGEVVLSYTYKDNERID